MKRVSPFTSIPLLVKIALREQGKGWKFAVVAFLITLPVFVSLMAQFTPDPDPRVLFYLEGSAEKDLQEGRVPGGLAEKLADQGYNLPEKPLVTTLKAHQIWEISQGRKKYFVQKERGKLKFLTTAKVPPRVWFIYLVNNLFLQYFIWLIPLLYGAEALREEIEKGTIHYLWIRPLPRWHLVVSKFLATLVWAMPSFLLSEAICFYLYGLRDFWLLLHVFGVTLLAGFYFAAIFQLLGVLFAKPLPAGIIYGFFFEVLLSSMADTAADRLTALYYLYGLLAPLTPGERPGYLAALPSPLYPVVGIFLVGVFALCLAGWVLSRKELKGGNI